MRPLFLAGKFKIQTYRAIRPLLAAMFASPASDLSVPGSLNMNRVDDVEKLLHHRHLFVNKVHLAVQRL